MFEVESLSYIKKIYPFEWMMVTAYILVIMMYSFYRQVTKMRINPEYRFYTRAVFVKLISSIVFCCVYIYYYKGGDTVAYFETSRSMVNLGFQHPGSLATVMLSGPSTENYFMFSSSTGYPWPYMYYDPQTLFVAKLLVPVLAVSFKSYLISSVMLSWISFFASWNLFRLMIKVFPGMERRLAFGLLFVPSVLFWGSGILKDTITFSGVCWFIYGFYWVVIGKQNRIRNALVMIAAAFVLISVKPYVPIALFPGTFIWFFHNRIINIRSRFLRYSIIPMIYVISIGIGYGLLSVLGNRLGKFSVERMLNTAAVTQQDLKQDYYHGSSFDIGNFEPTVPGMLAKAPIAMRVGLFQPFLWEARNIVMIISGLENFFYLILALILGYHMIRSPSRFFGVLFNQPMLLFLLSYSLIFSVLVGLSTSNFGALVRFKIPFLSSFVVLLLVMEALLRDKKTVYRTGNRGVRSGPRVPSFNGVARTE